MGRRPAVLFVSLWLACASGTPAVAAPRQDTPDGVAALLRQLERVMLAGDQAGYEDLLGSQADRALASEAARTLVSRRLTRAVLRERDRMPLDGTLPGDGYRLVVEAFLEYGDRARMATWRFDVRRSARESTDWAIQGQEMITVVDGLYRLSLNPLRQYRVRDLTIRAEDLAITVPAGRLFVAETQEGTTAVVVLPEGAATLVFSPAPVTEQEQVQLFAGTPVLESAANEIFLRVSPADFPTLFPASAIQMEPIDARLFARASGVFREEVGKSFSLDLGDLSDREWSLLPASGDIVAEVRTRKYQTLTYTRAAHDAEDISLFDRRRRKNISVYASRERIALRGRFFDEDAGVDYDITASDVDITFDPVRSWIQGRARISMRILKPDVASLTLRLAESLDVSSVFSPRLGRLLSFRVRNQNSLIVDLPALIMPDTDLVLDVEYGGFLAPARADRESLDVAADQEPMIVDSMGLPAEQSWLYTNRSYWYPHAPVSDYATATIRVTVPEGYGALASGERDAGPPEAVPPAAGSRVRQHRYVFRAIRPVRYLSCLVSRFLRAGVRHVSLDGPADGAAAPDTTPAPDVPGVYYRSLALTVEANPRLRARGQKMATTAAAVARFYGGLMGDIPYPSLTVGLIERDLPGGHSPAYLSVVHQPLPQTTFSWAGDPSAFHNYPEFFVAHELAHQWWGQAVGWRSYHEQWISEGFAQYFAALYAKHSRGDQAFQDVLRRMARFAREQSPQGPISLGYRLGHVRGDPRVFTSLVYNKAALVLHQLRLLLGDDVFMRGVRRFYGDWRFRKAGTDDVRRAFEAESGRDLGAYFERWIRASALPSVSWSWAAPAGDPSGEVVVTFEQPALVFDLPVTLTIQYADRSSDTRVVSLHEARSTVRLPVKGPVHDILVNADETSMAAFTRVSAPQPTRPGPPAS